ncbi:MAG: DNA ligase D, partial [Alphaproteobacteria bacterium]|nr:DNA ligase D [Alphaproteobacteria bacterium]
GDDWLHEIKLDGYRILCRLASGKAVLFSRNGLDWSARFPELAAALAKLPAEQAIIDGEVVRLEPSGRTSFPGLQEALSDGATAGLVYFVFDLLHLDGRDLTAAPLEARKAALLDWLGAARGNIRYSDHQIGRGPEFFRHACGFGLEGIVSKRRDAPYRGERSRSWLKIKCGNQDEFVVVGYSKPAGSRTGFGALILGYYDPGGRLRYAGRVGTGFDERMLTELHRRLQELVTKARPCGPPPKGTSTRDVHWVRPELVAEIRFTEWTRDLVLRQAAFLGLREDKAAREVVLDPGNSVPKPTKSSATKPAGARSGTITVAGVRLTNADKVLYPEDGVTKGDLAAYYERIAGWGLPHLAGRPLSLLRVPDGLAGERFFQKHMSRGMPEAIRHIEMAEEDGPKSMLYVEDAAGLVGLVQIGVLEIHPWGSTIERPELPDRLIFDLDPEEGLPWERIVEAALAMRQTLATLGLESFAKTTGGKGLHVVVPLTPKLDWDAAKAFTKAAAEILVTAAPDRYTTTLAKKARHGKIFIDYLRNQRGQTAVGAFSTRARTGAPVSAPVSWQEVEDGVRSDRFTTVSLPDRLAGLTADPWAGFFEVRQQLSAAMRRKLGL